MKGRTTTGNRQARNSKLLNKAEMMVAIKNSGYLFESEVSRKLANKGFFVENSPSYFDTKTQTSREIDMVVEDTMYSDERDITLFTCNQHKISVSSNYVLELKNNDFPLVLATEEEFSPNSEDEEAVKIFNTYPDGKELEFGVPDCIAGYSSGFFDEIFRCDDDDMSIFTQYFTFDVKKKGDKELFVCHPDELYSSLLKLCMFCDNKIFELFHTQPNSLLTDNNQWVRHHVHLPILLLKNDLYKLSVDNNKPTLEKSSKGVLKINYHFNEKQNSALIVVLTEKELFPFLKKMGEYENNIRKNILKDMGIKEDIAAFKEYKKDCEERRSNLFK